MPRPPALVLTALLLVPARALVAQSMHCFRPAPPPACAGFITFHLEYGHPLVQTKRVHTFERYDGGFEHIRVDDVAPYLMWRLGRMSNQGDGRAVGATIDLGFSERGFRIGAEGAKRYWTTGRQALDLSLGVVHLETARYNTLGETERRLALTGAVQYTTNDVIAAMLRADVAPSSHTTAALYGGAQLRSTGAVVGTLLIGAGVALLIAALTDPNY